MKYLLLCQVKPANFAEMSKEAGAKMMKEMMSYNHQLIQAGVLLAAGQLADPDTAQRVFAANGRIQTKEGLALAGDTQIGGYYLIDVPTEPQAPFLATKYPVAKFRSLELRQLFYSPM